MHSLKGILLLIFFSTRENSKRTPIFPFFRKEYEFYASQLSFVVYSTDTLN